MVLEVEVAEVLKEVEACYIPLRPRLAQTESEARQTRRRVCRMWQAV